SHPSNYRLCRRREFCNGYGSYIHRRCKGSQARCLDKSHKPCCRWAGLAPYRVIERRRLCTGTRGCQGNRRDSSMVFCCTHVVPSKLVCMGSSRGCQRKEGQMIVTNRLMPILNGGTYFRE